MALAVCVHYGDSNAWVERRGCVCMDVLRRHTGRVRVIWHRRRERDEGPLPSSRNVLPEPMGITGPGVPLKTLVPAHPARAAEGATSSWRGRRGEGRVVILYGQRSAVMACIRNDQDQARTVSPARVSPGSAGRRSRRSCCEATGTCDGRGRHRSHLMTLI
jgi:hypothetical protein